MHMRLLVSTMILFAAQAVRSVHRGALFLRLDGKDYRPGLWQLVRPAASAGNQVSGE